MVGVKVEREGAEGAESQWVIGPRNIVQSIVEAYRLNGWKAVTLYTP